MSCETASRLTASASPDPTAARPDPETCILIVDDERGPRESLRMILSGKHRVLTADGGANALEILRTESVDLVTVDLNMPGMKGDELIRTVRTDFPQIELIVITGSGSAESAIEGIRHGIFDYLTKPFDVIEVLTSVERAVARGTGRRHMMSFLDDLERLLGTNHAPEAVRAELKAIVDTYDAMACEQLDRSRAADTLHTSAAHPAKALGTALPERNNQGAA